MHSILEWLKGYDGDDYDYGKECGHIGIVSISATECQCMDCLRVWPKGPEFKSDRPQYGCDNRETSPVYTHGEESPGA